MPTAFSPNFDGENDRWRPFLRNAVLLDLEVYDRWGSRLFTATGANANWDGRVNGRAADTGIYVVRIRYADLRDGSEHEAAGDVLLIR